MFSKASKWMLKDEKGREEILSPLRLPVPPPPPIKNKVLGDSLGLSLSKCSGNCSA